ncbi:MAG: alpha/beta fold hydrolase [Pseudonocardiaceae bacterium]|nr:alpha/beta fold hydrolase [Pseudonocardiaceae bacterium]
MNRCDHLTIDGRTGFVEIAGDGPPVLCLHTAGQSGVQWRDVLRELPSHGYQVIVCDLPGHGRSEPAAGGPVTDLAYYRDWCLQLLAGLGVTRFSVVGCSIGGKIALDLAASAPEAVTSAVAMEADARNTRLSVRGLQRSLEAAAAPSVADRTYYGTLASCGAAVPGSRAELIATMHRREDPAISTSDLIGWAAHDLREQLVQIRCPLRLVAGADDFWLDLDDVRWTAAQVPGCRLDILEGIGHYPMEEIAGFPAVLAGWLAELAAAAAAA